jgi:hypothetical protein
MDGIAKDYFPAGSKFTDSYWNSGNRRNEYKIKKETIPIINAHV